MQDKKKLFDKMYDDNYTREEKIAAFRESVAIQRDCIKRKHRDKYIVINNGVETKKADPDMAIPQGWQRGFIRKGDRK